MSDNSIVWVTGDQGFVGSVISHRMTKAGFTVIGTDEELSVCEPSAWRRSPEEVQPGIIINCAGIRRDATGLSNRVKAYEVNALGARNVALVANTVGATVVQVSSDDVYSSRLDEPVNEFDNPHPDTPYGKSKRAGEMMVRNTTPTTSSSARRGCTMPTADGSRTSWTPPSPARSTRRAWISSRPPPAWPPTSSS